MSDIEENSDSFVVSETDSESAASGDSDSEGKLGNHYYRQEH